MKPRTNRQRCGAQVAGKKRSVRSWKITNATRRKNGYKTSVLGNPFKRK